MAGSESLVSVIIVHWNTAGELEKCVRALLDIRGLPLEIIVVDNASDDIDSLQWSGYPECVHLIRNTVNTGYAHATNQGLGRARGGFVLLLNPDVEVDEHGVRRLVETIESDPAAGAATARLNSPDGSFQRYCNRFPTFTAMIGRFTLLEPLMRGTSAVRNYLMLDMDAGVRQKIEQAPGACLMIHRPMLKKAGFMDERFPLFFNDVDFCRRIAAAGGAIAYVPDAVFTHAAQASVKKVRPVLLQAEFRVSVIRYFARWHSRPAAQALRAFILIDRCIRLAATAARVVAGKKSRDDLSDCRRGIAMLVMNRSMFEKRFQSAFLTSAGLKS
ncbi:MAG TPA: glycosyltransferase family 2 protein [bacterium]|nr:glycosyltransferase family 2 protein [bacterium]